MFHCLKLTESFFLRQQWYIECLQKLTFKNKLRNMYWHQKLGLVWFPLQFRSIKSYKFALFDDTCSKGNMLHISKIAYSYSSSTQRNLWYCSIYCPHLHVGSGARSLTTHVCITSSWSCWRSHLIEWRIPPHEALMKGFHLNDRDITAAQAPDTNKRGENIVCSKCYISYRWSYIVFFTGSNKESQ